MKNFILKASTILCLCLFTLSLFSNILTNGDFESNLENWNKWFDNSTGYDATFQISNTEVYNGSASGQVIINSIDTDEAYHKIMVKNTSFQLQANVNYKATFYLKSNSIQDFQVQVHQDSNPYTTYGSMVFTASTNWEQYSFTFTSPVTTTDVRFAFKLGNSVATYYFDDIEIFEFSEVYDSVIDPNYSIDWSQSGIPGGIPNVPETINVLDFGAIGDGRTDNLEAFKAALSAANPGEAVLIPAGTYRINGSLQIPEGRVLRGECPSNTRLEFEVNAATPCLDIIIYEYNDFQPVLNGFVKGSRFITVNDPTVFSVGDYAEMQQENDPDLMYTRQFWDQSWAANSVGQLFEITDISGNQLELDRPVFYGLNPDMNPEIRPIGLIEEVGIEDLYVERLDATDGPVISMKNAARCWVKNIESNMTYRAHVYIYRSLDCEVRGSYFHHSHDYGGGGHGYGVDLSYHTTSALIENNTFEYLRHSMMIQLGATGNVLGYNYSTEPFWSESETNIPADISMHGHFPTMNLFEGNIVEEATFSDWWGPVGPGNTMFRNRVTTSDIYVGDHSHHQNIIANELTGEGANVITHSSVQNTWTHSNNTNGTINPTTTAALPASLYRNDIPDFLAGYPFPAFGPDVTLGANSIPAKDRFEQADELCNTVCPNFNDDLIGQSCDDENPNTENDVYATDCICTGAPVSINDCYLINNGDFGIGTTGWGNWKCNINPVSGACHITNIEQGSSVWHAAVHQGDFMLENGKSYEITFEARAIEGNRTVRVKAGLSEDPYTGYHYQTVTLNTNSQLFSIPFTMLEPTTNKARLEFHLGQSSIGLILDNVQLKSLSSNCDDDCEQVENGNFTNGPDGLDSWIIQNCTAEYSSTGIDIDVPYASENFWDIAVKQAGFVYEQGKQYQVTFNAKAEADRSIQIKAGKSGTPYTTYHIEKIYLTTLLEPHTFTFTMDNTTDRNGYFEYFLGESDTNVFLSDISLVEISCSNLRENEPSSRLNEAINVYPNPAKELLHIKLNLADTESHSKGNISLFDLNGKLLLQQKTTFDKQVYELDIEQTPTGVYMLKLDFGDRLMMQKVIKY